MSVVAVKITGKGKYEMAADSILVRGDTQSKGDRSYSSKIMKVNGMVIGASGKAKETTLLFVFCATRKPTAATIPAVLTFLAEFAEWKKKAIDTGDIENWYLIGFAGKVFHVNGWYVEEVRTHEAIGAGMDYALAALHLGHNVKSAVEVACDLSIYCERPVVVYKVDPRTEAKEDNK